MTALLRASIARTPIVFTRISPVSGTRGMSDHSTRRGNDPEVLQRNKETLLRKHAKDSTETPHWREELASDAEAFVKSQRDEIPAASGEIFKLQERTKKRLDSKTDKNR